MQYRYPKNYDIVYRALKKAHREDLIGSGPKCLIPAKRPKEVYAHKQRKRVRER